MLSMIRLALILFFMSPLVTPLVTPLVSPVQANEPGMYLVTPNFSSPYLSPIENNAGRELIIQTSAKQGTYHLLFENGEGNDGGKIDPMALKKKKGSGVSVYSLDVKVESLGDEKLKLSVAILSLPKRKTVRRVYSKPFERKEFRIKMEKALLVLFSDAYPKAQKSKKEKNKKKLSGQEALTGGEVKKNEVAFKMRIQNLKKGISQAFNKHSQSSQKEKEEESAKASNSQENTREEKSNESFGAELALDREQSPKRNKKKGKKNKIWLSHYSFGAGLEFQNYEIENDQEDLGIFQTRTNFQYLKFGGEASLKNVNHPGLSAYAWGYYLLPAFSDEDVKAQSALNFGFGGSALLEPLRSELTMGIEKNTNMYAFLPDFGTGAVLAVYDLYWATIGVKFKVSDQASVSAQIARLLQVQGQNEYSRASELEANSFKLGARMPAGFIGEGTSLKLDGSYLSFLEEAPVQTKGSEVNISASLFWGF